MRLLFLTPSYPPMIGGGEHYAQALARELVRRGHELTVVTTAIAQPQDFWAGSVGPPAQASDIAAGVAVIRLSVRALPLRRTGLLALRKAMVLASVLGPIVEPLLVQGARQFPAAIGLDEALAGLPRPDLVHAFNISWEHFLLAAHCHAQKSALPHIVTPFLHVGVAGQRRVWRNSAMPHQRRLLASADAVLALSETERQGLVDLGVRPGVVHVVGAAIAAPPGPSIQDDGPIATRLASSPHPLVLFLGRADRDKGALTAMRAVAQLNEQGLPCDLALAGHPSSEAMRLARRLSSRGAPIHLLGSVDEGVKHWLLQRCIALVLPSRVESFGLVVIEAWQHGKPVIAADVGGPRSLIRHGENGLLVPWGSVDALANALALLLAAPELARQLGENGQVEAAQEFTWCKVAERVESVYASVLHGRSSTVEARPAEGRQ